MRGLDRAPISAAMSERVDIFMIYRGSRRLPERHAPAGQGYRAPVFANAPQRSLTRPSPLVSNSVGTVSQRSNQRVRYRNVGDLDVDPTAFWHRGIKTFLLQRDLPIYRV